MNIEKSTNSKKNGKKIYDIYFSEKNWLYEKMVERRANIGTKPVVGLGELKPAGR